MKHFLFFLFLLGVAGLGWHFYSDAIEEHIDVGEIIETPILFGKDALLVDDQMVNESIEVRLLALSKRGFVVVQDDEQGPGSVVGTSELLDAGRKRSVKIPLTKDLIAGYAFVSLYRDDGDGRFDIETDIPIRGPGLAPVQQRVLLTESPGDTEDRDGMKMQ